MAGWGGANIKMTLATRLAVAMILLVALAVSAVGWLSHRGFEQAVIPRVLDGMEAHSRLIAADLESYVAGVSGDIASYRNAAALNGLIRARVAGGVDRTDGVSEATWRARLATGFAGVLEAKPAYSKLCIIGLDDDRREIFRVDRMGANGAVRSIPEPELRRKAAPHYFNATLQLPPGEIHVSPVGVDRGMVATATPNNPTLHVATPIFAPDGKPFGILLIEIDMRPVLDRIRSSARPGAAIYAVNGRGEYLVHPDPAREFSAQPDLPTGWQNDFPDLAPSLGTRRSLAQIQTDHTGRRGGIALAPAVLVGKEWVAVIEAIPNAVFMAPAAAIRDTSLLVGLIAVLCAAALAVFIARTLTRPIIQLTAAVEGAGRDGLAAIPVDAGGETGVLARAFARVMGEANAKTAALEHEVQEHRRTEAARDHYAARERIFSAAVESSIDAIVTKSLDGFITGWNPAAEHLFGYPATEAVGQPIDLIVPSPCGGGA